MTMLATKDTGGALSLVEYEARIHLYKEQIGTGYIGIGRTLNEAKAAKVVPHGEWESWVTRVTGLSERQAQKCMQAATEIKEGSALAQLEMSKAILLLGSGLDQETREEIAGKAVEDGATVKALKEEIRQAKLKLVQETGAAAEIRHQLGLAKAERDSLEEQMKATVKAYQGRMDEERESGYQRGAMDAKAEALAQAREEADRKIREIRETLQQKVARNAELAGRLNKAQDALEDKDEEIDKLKVQLLELENNRAGLVPEDYESLKANQADLLAAAEEAEKRAADAEAELEALRAGQDPAAEPPAIILGKAVNAFLGACELMPFYPDKLREDRGVLMNLVDQLDGWCDRMQQAIHMATVEAEGAVE